MNPVVQSLGSFGGRHHADVMMSARRMDGEASLAIRCINLGFGLARHYAPLEKPPRSAEG
eukprot:1517954-Pleurochrysis_carterae.AAC.1